MVKTMSLQQQREMLRRVGITTLGDVLDESHDVTVRLAAYPLIRVVSINAPSTARPGGSVSISFVWQNDGGEGFAWWRVIDLDTMQEYVPRSTGGATPGSQLQVTVPPITMPNRDLHVRIEVGHIED